VTIRAKFKCVEETRTAYGEGRKLKFSAVYDPDLAEDRSFSKYTPSANLEMHVDNPNAAFEVGADYYVDFTPVTEGRDQ
jgi:hypothetical protein